MDFKEIFPPLETALEMAPEELGPFVLRQLKTIPHINRHNYTLEGNAGMVEYAGGNIGKFRKCLMEAWVWLEREMFIAPDPGQDGSWAFITRMGEQVLQSQDFSTYAKESLLAPKTLDPVLVRKVKPLFLRGDYDTAIFQAFKEVEIRVRREGGYDKQDIGVSLMRKAFHPQTGTLTNKMSEQGEKQAMSDFFAGAIGLFKNPVSHRDVGNVSPEFAADAIRVANCLLGITGDKEV